MNKKIFILIICLILTTACNNQNTKEEISQNSLCIQIETDINNYQNKTITKEELYSKLENYNDTCNDLISDICINLKAIITIPKDREELRNNLLQKISENCHNK